MPRVAPLRLLEERVFPHVPLNPLPSVGIGAVILKLRVRMALPAHTMDNLREALTTAVQAVYVIICTFAMAEETVPLLDRFRYIRSILRVLSDARVHAPRARHINAQPTAVRVLHTIPPLQIQIPPCRSARGEHGFQTETLIRTLIPVIASNIITVRGHAFPIP